MREASSDASPVPESPLILVVDDSPDDRQMYSVYLTDHGYRVIQATNGLEAIAQADSHRPDLILMNLRMPHLDGWEATRRIKAERRTRHVRVLAITGDVLGDAAARAIDAGADGCLIKPARPATMLEKIRELLNRLPGMS